MPTSPNAVLPPAKDCDGSIYHQVGQTLQRTGYAALQRINCRVENGVVELSGDVPSFYFKQIAQEVLLALKHVQRVDNRLRVP